MISPDEADIEARLDRILARKDIRRERDQCLILSTAFRSDLSPRVIQKAELGLQRLHDGFLAALDKMT